MVSMVSAFGMFWDVLGFVRGFVAGLFHIELFRVGDSTYPKCASSPWLGLGSLRMFAATTSEILGLPLCTAMA